jgi:hypothetical protein
VPLYSLSEGDHGHRHLFRSRRCASACQISFMGTREAPISKTETAANRIPANGRVNPRRFRQNGGEDYKSVIRPETARAGKKLPMRYHTFGFNRLEVGRECRVLSLSTKLTRRRNTHAEPTMSGTRSVTDVTELDGIASTHRLTIDVRSVGLPPAKMPTA